MQETARQCTTQAIRSGDWALQCGRLADPATSRFAKPAYVCQHRDPPLAVQPVRTLSVRAGERAGRIRTPSARESMGLVRSSENSGGDGSVLDRPHQHSGKGASGPRCGVSLSHVKPKSTTRRCCTNDDVHVEVPADGCSNSSYEGACPKEEFERPCSSMMQRGIGVTDNHFPRTSAGQCFERNHHSG